MSVKSKNMKKSQRGLERFYKNVLPQSSQRTQRKTIRRNGEVENEGKITNFTGMHRIFRIYIYPVYLVYPCLNSSPFPFFLLFSLIFFTFCLSLCPSVSSVLQWLKLGFCSQSFDTTLSRIISATPSFDIWGIS